MSSLGAAGDQTIARVLEGQRFGRWTVAAVNGRRAICRCSCRTLRQVAVADLVAGISTSCGCAPTPLQLCQAEREAKAARLRERDRDWRPGRRRP